MQPVEYSFPRNSRDWHQKVWRLAAPIMLSNLSIPLVGAVDTAVVGHLPDPAYIGAVALGAMIFSFLFWGFGFLRMGTTGFVAQAYGAGDNQELLAVSVRALLLALALGCVLMVFQAPIASGAFWLLDAGPSLETLTREYYSIRILAAPATLANYVILGCLIGIHDTRAVFIVQLALNGANVVLDLVFVMGFGWAIEGVALASVISEYAAVGLGLYLMHRRLPGREAKLSRRQIMDAGKITALLSVNADIFIRTLLVIFAFSYFTAMSARQGEIILAANSVLMHFQQFLAYGLDGFAHAAEALAGSAYGARNASAFRAAVRTTTVWALLTAVAATLLYALLAPPAIALFSNHQAVRATAADYLPWLLLSPIVSVWSFQFDGIFIGATRTKEMRNAMALALAIYLLAVWMLLPLWGNHGLWAALIVLMAARGLTLAMYYPRLLRSLGSVPEIRSGL